MQNQTLIKSVFVNLRKLILLVAVFMHSSNALGQNEKLDSSLVWTLLYPSNQNFDNENRLMREVNRDGANFNFKTEIANIFYYKVGLQQRAVVVLFSYKYDPKYEVFETCHACAPEFELATFSYSKDMWSKQKFLQNWEGAQGSYGEGAEVKLKNLNKKTYLIVSWGYGNFGEFEDYTNYYDLETFKNVKSIVKKSKQK